MPMIPDARLVELIRMCANSVTDLTGSGSPDLQLYADELSALRELQELRANQQGRGWVESSKRLPIDADGDYFGRILAATWSDDLGWMVSACHTHAVSRMPHRYKLWMSHPVMPHDVKLDAPLPPPYQGAK